jgi:hypothetical protein
MVLVIGFLLLLSLLLTTSSRAFPNTWDRPCRFRGGHGVFGFVVSFAVITLLFASIFKLLPDAKVKWRDVWVGAIATALLFESESSFWASTGPGKHGVPVWRRCFRRAAPALGLLRFADPVLRGEFTQVYARTMGEKIQPSANAEAVTEEARAQQGLGVTPEKARPQGLGEAGSKEPGPLKESPLAVLGRSAEEGEVDPSEGPDSFVENNATALVFASIGGGFLLGMLLRRKPGTRPFAR